MSYEFWDRDSLYEEVWATPMAKLAKKYGISDVGLAKVCRKLAIPLPVGVTGRRERRANQFRSSRFPR